MHEFDTTQRIFEVAMAQADLKEGERIRTLHLLLDPDAGYTPDAIRFYFTQIAENTPASGAELEFEVASQPQAILLKHIEIAEEVEEGIREEIRNGADNISSVRLESSSDPTPHEAPTGRSL